MFRNAKKLAGKGRKPKLFMLDKNSFKANAVWRPNRSHNETASALASAPKAKSRPVSRKAGGGIPSSSRLNFAKGCIGPLRGKSGFTRSSSTAIACIFGLFMVTS